MMEGKRDTFIAFGWASYWQGDTTERDGEREGGVDGIGPQPNKAGRET